MLMHARTCAICDNGAAHATDDGSSVWLVKCPRCGEYSISHAAAHVWRESVLTPRPIANAGGWLREHQKVAIDHKGIELLRSLPTPSVGARADKVMAEIGKRFPLTGHRVEINMVGDSGFDWLGLSWSVDEQEFKYLLLTYLKAELGYLISTSNQEWQNSMGRVRITPRGYNYLEQRTKASPDSHIGFSAMWFDKKLERMWTAAAEPAILSAGYEPKRMDKHHHNNRIDDEIIAMIRRSKFVVADFTGQRGGVYFEAGFALGLDLPVIWTCRENELDKIHFDNRQYNFVTWGADLADFKSKLQNRIVATLGEGTYTPPT